MNTIRVILDCYPETGSDPFVDYEGAIVSCWVKLPGGTSPEAAAALSREKVATQGWGVAGPIRTEPVSAASYQLQRSEHRERFEQAQLDGFVAQFYRTSREVVALFDGDFIVTESKLTRAVSSIRESGCFVFMKRSTQELPSRRTRNENEYRPLFSSFASAMKWADLWPECSVTRVPFREVHEGSKGTTEADDEPRLALEIGDDAMVTCHPEWVRRALYAERRLVLVP